MNERELESLFRMVEELIEKVRGTPGVTEEELYKIQEVIQKYRVEQAAEDVKLLAKMREDLYALYNEHHTKVKTLERYTPAWEKERRLRDMYFKFLNIPILFMIGMRDDSFNVNNENGIA